MLEAVTAKAIDMNKLLPFDLLDVLLMEFLCLHAGPSAWNSLPDYLRDTSFSLSFTYL